MNAIDPDGRYTLYGDAARDYFRGLQNGSIRWDDEDEEEKKKKKKGLLVVNTPNTVIRKNNNGQLIFSQLQKGDYSTDALLDNANELWIGFTPIGTLFDIKAGISGEDMSGEQVSPFWRMAGLVPFVSELRKGKRIWTSTKQLSSVENAFAHWQKHSAEFPELQNAKQYVEATYDFLQNSPFGTLSKVRTNGDVIKYHPTTNTFGVMDKSGVPKTMFRPTEGMQYWLRQN